MTSPSWCPACEESCPEQPDGICTTCGEELEQLPLSSYQNNEQNNSPRQLHDPESLLLISRSTGIDASLWPVVNPLRPMTNNDQGGISDIVSLLPPEALNPQAGTSRHPPASKRVLEKLKRVILTDQSAELFDAHILLFGACDIHHMPHYKSESGDCLKLNAIPGEFGPTGANAARNNFGSSNTRTAALVVCSPRTTKGGLSSSTLAKIRLLQQQRLPFIAYVERGDGITFAQKAFACQNAGKVDVNSSCIGVIVGNAGSGDEVWPYIMQDTNNEAEQLGLTVPVVMVRREDGNRLVQWNKDLMQYIPCQMHIRSKKEHSCPVCTECYVSGATIVRLPACGHVFHETCAMMWLTKHNTCPYCRKEMPTDDEEYEAERRRREARGQDGNAAENEARGNSIYG